MVYCAVLTPHRGSTVFNTNNVMRSNIFGVLLMSNFSVIFNQPPFCFHFHSLKVESAGSFDTSNEDESYQVNNYGVGATSKALSSQTNGKETESKLFLYIQMQVSDGSY